MQLPEFHQIVMQREPQLAGVQDGRLERVHRPSFRSSRSPITHLPYHRDRS
jgi:hypothetical protein